MYFKDHHAETTVDIISQVEILVYWTTKSKIMDCGRQRMHGNL